MGLPGRQADLVRAVTAANPRTVVLVNAGSVVDLDCADDAAAIAQTWYLGQETGHRGGRCPDRRHTPPPGACRSPTADGSRTGRRGSTTPARRAVSSTARSSSWATGASTSGGSSRVGASATASATRRSSGVRPRVDREDLPIAGATTTPPRHGADRVRRPHQRRRHDRRRGRAVLRARRLRPRCAAPTRSCGRSARSCWRRARPRIVELELDERAFAAWEPTTGKLVGVAGRCRGPRRTLEQGPPWHRADPDGPARLTRRVARSADR